MKLRTLDLFHGAGGCSKGAQMAGAEIVAGIDFWRISSNVFKKNFPNALVVDTDIRKVSPKQMRNKIGEIDLIVASPECTNHSCAKGSRPRCEESKETAFQVTRFAKEFKPKWIIIENVIQMRSWSGHQKLLEELWESGYFIKEQILNAQDFGVSQSRKRLFLICSLSGEAKMVETKKMIPEPAGSIIAHDSEYHFSPLYSPKRAAATLVRAERAISELGQNEPFLIVYYGTDGSGGWQTLDKPLRTVTTIDRFAFVKPTAKGHVMRMLQPEELKLAMGFPEKFILDAGTRRDKIKLLGNAVCPPVMKEIVLSLVS